MRRKIGNKIDFPTWADDRYKRLYELDLLLDGKFYDHLPLAWYDQMDGGVPAKIENKRPAVRFNLFSMLVNHVKRKTFAGTHAPAILNPKEKVRLAMQALYEEGKLESLMQEVIRWGSVGSCAVTFKIVAYTDITKKKRAKLIAKTWRARMCTPTFDEIGELKNLRVHYTLPGTEFINDERTMDSEGERIKRENVYWYVKDFGATEETFYLPIPESKWDPTQQKSDHLVRDENPSFPNPVGFVQAHWFQNGTGDERPYDGTCFWEDAVPLVIELDFTVSQLGTGIRYSGAPTLVIVGDPSNKQDDGSLATGPQNYIAFPADFKNDEVQESGGHAELLEMKGTAIEVGMEWYVPYLEKLAHKVVCASLKDPNKLTTAMSGKGMEQLEAEFLDLVHEMRSVFNFLDLLKKMAIAAIIAKHPLMKGIKIEDVDATTLGYPPLSSVGAVEFNNLIQGAVGAIEAEMFTTKEMRDYVESQIDRPATSANKDYTIVLDSNDQGQLVVKTETESAPAEGSPNGNEEYKEVGAAMVAAAAESVADTSLL